MINIKKYREKQGLLQKELAEKLNVKRTTITNWENGLTSPRISLLPKIAKILKCKIDDLFK